MVPLRYYLHFSRRKNPRLESENRLKNTNSGDKHMPVIHFYKLDVSYATNMHFQKYRSNFENYTYVIVKRAWDRAQNLTVNL